MDIRYILDIIRPSAEYGWQGGDPSDSTQVIWRDVAQIEPTLQEYTDGWALAQIELAKATFVEGEMPTSEASALSDLSPFKGKTYAEIKTIIQNEIDGWATLSDAKITMRKWLPIIIAAFIWAAFRQLNE